MSVGSFDPKAAAGTANAADLDRLRLASESLEEPRFALSDHEVARLGRLCRTDAADWPALAKPLDSAALVALIRLLTLAEGKLPEFEAGARSPVVPLAAELKSRGDYPEDLTGWIRANSQNRFLPHGSLMDRL